MKKFKETFVFGADTAAYQAEGAVNENGKGKCIWDNFLHREESTFNLDDAVDFYHRYPEDLKLGQKYHFQAIRISIAWSRIFPNNAYEINKEGLKFYRDLLTECWKNGVEPYVTLHHFDSPQWLFEKGDFLNKEAIEDFVRFAEVCFDEFDNLVKKWVTFNETYVYGSDKFIIGEAPPQHKYDVGSLVQQMHNMTVAHAKTVSLFKGKKYDGEIGIVHVLQPKYPHDENNANDILSAEIATSLFSGLMLDANFKGVYSSKNMTNVQQILSANNAEVSITNAELEAIAFAKGKTDFLGINYYCPSWFIGGHFENEISHNGTGKKGGSIWQLKGLGKNQKPDYVPTNDWDWAIWPQGLEEILIWIANEYPNYNKMYITENGLGWKETVSKNQIILDDYRIDYINNHLQAILNAIDKGANVEGYFAWSWMDVPSWTNGFNKRYGFIYVDYDNRELTRLPKLSAEWYKEVIDKQSLDVDLEKIKDNYLNQNAVKTE